ncbi:MAG: glycosyltransferase [Gammaproteobacteria bacterium]
MQKILVLTSTFPRWKDDSDPPFVYELCKKLALNHEIIVLTPHAAGAAPDETIDGVRVVRFRYFFERFETLCYEGGILARLKQRPLRYLLIPFFVFSQFISAYKLIKSERISVIHAHWIIPQGLIAIALRHLVSHRLHILCTSHGSDLFSLNGKLFRFIKRRILLDADAISVVSPIMAEEVDRICYPFKRPVSVIPMGIDFQNTFKPSATVKREPFSLVYVGRLVETKGVKFLIQAMPEILQRFPRAHLTIVGDGLERGYLQGLAGSLGLSGQITFTGSVLNRDLPGIYQKHLIAVFPFIGREGLGLVIPEAVGCGCCIVTTALPGMEDLIVHNHNGYIIKSKSSEAISQEIIRLFSDPAKISELQTTAYDELTALLDINTIGSKYSALIESLTEHP